MDRLTYENSRGMWDSGKHPTKYTSRNTFQEVVARLAAYEDTGLEPEEVDRILDAYGRGMTLRTENTERLQAIKGIAVERLREIAEAERGGRLVVPPCKVGDTVWTNIVIVGDRYKSADRPYPVEVVFIGIGEDKGFFHVQYSNRRIFSFDFDKMGKTVFLTREEAEAALKKMEEADNETD